MMLDMLVDSYRFAVGRVPIGVCVAGPKRDLLLSMTDPALKRLTRPRTIKTPYGHLELDPGQDPERLLMYAFTNVMRHYEKSELGRYLRKTATAGRTFVDVGANLGTYSLLAKQCGMIAIAVEPEPAHANFLARNESVFGKSLPVAFSDRPGKLPLYYKENNPGATTLFHAPNRRQSAESVPVTTFSNAARAGQLGNSANIQLVKIDVEGFEEFTVAGMVEFLGAGHRPDIWCEVRGDQSGRNGGSYRRVREILATFDYRASELKRGGQTSVNEEDLSGRKVFDLLFTCARPAA